MSPSTRKALRTILAIVVALAVYAWREGWLTGATTVAPAGPNAPTRTGAGDRTTAPAPDRDGRPGAGYAPPSPEPRDAIPGGGLAAHEGVDGGHTLDRHVGRTLEQLRRRLAQDGKREVSTFLDEASADRFVAQALYDRRSDVARWLTSNPSGNEAFPSRLATPAGSVLRSGARDVVTGRSVNVVLAPSRRFREGFRIVTAYVTLP